MHSTYTNVQFRSLSSNNHHTRSQQQCTQDRISFDGTGRLAHFPAVSGASEHRDSSCAQHGTASQATRSWIVEVIVLILLRLWPLPPKLAYDRHPCRSFWAWNTWWEPSDNSTATERVEGSATAYFEVNFRGVEGDRLWQNTPTWTQLQPLKRKWFGDEVAGINSSWSTDTSDECKEERSRNIRWEALLLSRQQHCGILELEVESRSAIFSIISFDPLPIMSFDHQLYRQNLQQCGMDGEILGTYFFQNIPHPR